MFVGDISTDPTKPYQPPQASPFSSDTNATLRNLTSVDLWNRDFHLSTLHGIVLGRCGSNILGLNLRVMEFDVAKFCNNYSNNTTLYVERQQKTSGV